MRPFSFGAPFLLAALLVGGCHGTFRELPVEGGTTKQSRVEPRLSRIASSLVGESVEVRCWTQRDWRELIEDRDADSQHEFAGIAAEGGPVDLAPEACAPVVQLAYSRQPAHGDAELALAYAIGVFAHELEHVRGEMDEETAECHGVQRLAAVARELGATAEEARYLARLYWQAIYPDSDRGYRTTRCRDGGELDLRPRSSSWP